MRHLLLKELLQLRRNSFLPRLILLFPVMIMCVMPWVMDMEVRNVGLAIVDNDHSLLSRRLIQRVSASSYFRTPSLLPSYEEALRWVEADKADVILEIPQHYERYFGRGSVPTVFVAANAVNGTKGSLGSSYVTQIVALNLSASLKRPVRQAEAVSFSPLSLYNSHLDYKRYMIPALMSILVMMMCGFLPALNIVGEKESGTIEQINVTPVGKLQFILAKLIPYWCIGALVLSVCLLLSWLLYGITPQGSVGLVYLLSMLLALVFSGLGLAVSNYSDTMQQAILVMWFFVVCMMLLSGLFTPISSMPPWAQAMTRAIPTRYYIDAIRTVFLRGGTLADILPQTLALLCFALAFCLWAVLSYRKKS
ncbi:MAG: ABC transporter permease [Prevotellaceae bacterium]|nr:ABC transporter permease [Prevotellaceae bacterium]